MNRALLKKAELRITEKRQFAEERARNFLQQALQNKNFEALYKQQKSLEIEFARKEVYGEKVDYSIIDKLKLEQEHILKEMGLNGTDITPNYECKECGDSGYIEGKPCDCLKKEINKELFSYSGFVEKLADFSENNSSHPAFSLMEKWCETKSTKTNVLISGKAGAGKTFLTQCIAKRLMDKNRVVLFSTAFNLNNAMLTYHSTFTPGRENIIDPFLSSEVLIIDDLGTEPMIKNVTQEYIYLIINERMLKNLPTIITTNLSLNEINTHYGERIFSRLANKKTSILINLESNDKRLG